MIICHPLKLIYLKTKKVGGTSFEVVLSKYCGPECVITPISPFDESVRNGLGFRSAQNFLESTRVGYSDLASINFGLKGDFASHSGIGAVETLLKSPRFQDYKTLAIHRKPNDFLISQYYFQKGTQRLNKNENFETWYSANKYNVYENYRIAPIKGTAVVDIVIDYENLDETILDSDFLPNGFASLFKKLRLKGQYRDSATRNADDFFLDHGLDPAEPKQLLEAWR